MRAWWLLHTPGVIPARSPRYSNPLCSSLSFGLYLWTVLNDLNFGPTLSMAPPQGGTRVGKDSFVFIRKPRKFGVETKQTRKHVER